jgi:O-antigen ligase
MSGLHATQEPAVNLHIRPREVVRTVKSAYPWWFLLGSGGVAALGYVGIPPTTIFVLSLLVLLASVRDLWQLVLSAALGALVLATTGPRGVQIALEQPFLLRFVLLAGLAALLILLHPPSFAGRHAGRTQLLLGAFIIWAGISAALSPFPSTAIQAVLGAGITFAVPAIAVRGRWRDREILLDDLLVMHRLLWLFALIGIAFAAAEGFSGRAYGLHDNPNTLGFMSALGFGLGLGLRLRMRPVIGWITLSTFSVAVVASGSRGALIGVVAAMGYLLLRSRARRRTVTVAGSLLVGVAVLLAVPTAGPFDIAATYTRTFGGDEVDLAGRQVRWDDMRTLIAQRPLIGHGLRASGEVLGLTRAQGLTTSSGGHSSYLTVTAETGVIGAVLLFGGALMQLRRKPPSDEAGMVAWLAGSGVVVAGLGHMVGESFILGVGSPFPLVFWTGVIVLSGITRLRVGP